jgi:hypothetical protein
MLSRVASLVALCSVLVAGELRAVAGGIHIRYGPDAPERLAASNLRYYQGVLNLEHNHPIAFAREHPFYTEMFHNPAMMDRLVARWQAHEQRFEYWHDCLWKVLDGYVVSHPEQNGHFKTSASSGGSPGPVEFGARGPADLGFPILNPNEPGGIHPDNGGGGVTVNAVPEPSSGLLIVMGTLVAGCWAARRSRFSSPPSPTCPALD